jgi:hypothetical protein
MINVTLADFLRCFLPADAVNSVPSWHSSKTLKLAEVTDVDSHIAFCKARGAALPPAGAHRKQDWEHGWAGAGIVEAAGEYNNVPYYFKKNTHIRVSGRLFRDEKGFAELDLLRALQSIVFSRYLPRFETRTVIEYGCGTGSNIQFLSRTFSEINFYAADWAESAVSRLIRTGILRADRAFLVDYFRPETFTAPTTPFIAFTNASLEQTGRRYRDFLEYLFDNQLCLGAIHIEPIPELLDLSSALNRQSFDYARQRGYLEGFYDYLRESEVDLITAYDSNIGSTFISGYQVIVWTKSK